MSLVWSADGIGDWLFKLAWTWSVSLLLIQCVGVYLFTCFGKDSGVFSFRAAFNGID